jgi:hypothetical protein
MRPAGLNRADLAPSARQFRPINEQLCSSGGKTRPAKNTYGGDFHLLSAGSYRACHLLFYDLLPLYRDRRGRKAPAVRALGDFMKDISTILLASVFVLFSLIVLLSAASTPDRTSSTLDNDQQKVSDLGLRFAFKR